MILKFRNYLPLVKLSLKHQFSRRQILSSSWFLYVYRWRSQQTLFRTPFNWVPIFGKLDFWFKLVCSNFSIIIYSFVCRFLLHNYSYYYNQKQPSSGVLQERFSYKFAKFRRKHLCWRVLFLVKLQIYIV